MDDTVWQMNEPTILCIGIQDTTSDSMPGVSCKARFVGIVGTHGFVERQVSYLDEGEIGVTVFNCPSDNGDH